MTRTPWWADLDETGDTLEVSATVRVDRVERIGWGYRCKDPDCGLTAAGTRWHALAGFPTRALALDVAREHVGAVRERREVIA